MSEPRRCPQCDAEIPANSPAGLCPRCLLKASSDSQSAAASVDPGPTKLTPPNSGFVPPTVEELAPLFPQLEILELLGKGGMGAVYKARQPGLDRLVALKILPPEISHDPAFAERFQREARALARLSHPHIVAVYDFGVVGQAFLPDALAPSGQAGKPDLQAGLCYIVMEFVDGANLRQTIKAGKLAAAEALAIVPQICEALQFAHDEGIVHRDIKPENILIDKRGRVKIADFGLAKLLGTDASDHSLTATHQVMGTLRYMAPEQMQGSREVDHRADIYSLGVVFYELLTGELPMGRFAPPSKKVQVDVRLDEVVLRALEQDPEQRYQQASEIKNDVESVTSKPLATPLTSPLPVTPVAIDSRLLARIYARSIDFMIAGIALTSSGLMGFLYGIVMATRYAASVSNPGDNVAWRSAFGALSFLPILACGIATFIGSLTMKKLLSHGFNLVVSILLVALLPAVVIINRGPPPQVILFQVAFSLYAGIRAFRLLRKPEVEAVFAGRANELQSCIATGTTGPRLSRCAVIGAIWAPLFFIAAAGSLISFDVPAGEHHGPAWWQLALAFTLLPLGVLAPFGTTILGAVGIAKIKRSEGKLYGLRLAQADALLFPLLVLGALAFLAGFVLLRGPLRGMPPMSSGLDERFYQSPLQEFTALLIALPIWFFPARALFRAVVGPRDAFELRKLPLIGDEPLTGKAALVVTLAAVLSHAWPWHWMIPPNSTARTISNFDVIIALQSFWLLVGSIGLALFASASELARPAKIILRVGSVVAVIIALVIQVRFFNSLGEYDPGVERVVRLTRTYSHMGVYVTMALTGLAILFFLLRIFDELGGHSPSQASGQSSSVPLKVEVGSSNLESLTSASAGPLKRPRMVPVWAAMNLVGSVFLMLISVADTSGESTAALPRLWQVWEQVDTVLCFTMAAALFMASIGLFLRASWARRLMLAVCVYGLASVVLDAPYIARVGLPDFYAEVHRSLANEGIEPEARDFVAMFTVATFAGGFLLVFLSWLIGQLVYFTRSRVIAAFASPNERPNRFIEWIFTGTGAVVGVLSVFGPIALLIVLATLFNPSPSTVSTTKTSLSAPPPLGTITSGIGAEFTVPAGQVAVFEIVTRSNGETVPVPPHCGYVMAPPDAPIAGTLRWSPKVSEDASTDGRRKWSLEIVTAGGGRGYSEATLLPEELNSAVGSRGLTLGTLVPNEEVIHWGISDVRDLPNNGSIGLRVTVVAHGMKHGGSGNAHIDWKKSQSATSTTRRKLSGEVP